MASAAAQAVTSAPYRRRRPERTPLYQVVQDWLTTYLELARQEDWDGDAVPPYVEREFRRFLECGILACGFARAYCDACGHAFLVAFSCKGRGYAEYMNMLSKDAWQPVTCCFADLWGH